MIQYLLNVTAIWMLSLTVFDVFLRRETFHGNNRYYLLSTFLMGIVLPFFTLQQQATLPNGTTSQPIMQAAAIKGDIIRTVTPSTPSFNLELILWFCYGTGALIMLCLLLREVFVLARLYKQGVKTKEHGWIIIETGKNTSPFSIFGYLFVGTRQQYSTDEWNTILRHEWQHKEQWHFIDLVIMQLSKVIFWFHPFVYIYYNRLSLVHEFQADHVAADKANEYGQFLVEQSMLQTAPSITHSLNRSPIKNRMYMLTHKSAVMAKAKFVLVLPLVIVSFTCFTKNAFSDDKMILRGNKLTYRGNTFVMWAPPHDTVLVEDPVTGKQNMVVTSMDSMPVKMNGTSIYKTDDLTADEMATFNRTTQKEIEDMVLSKIKGDLENLDDATYRIFTSVVIDTKGKIVFTKNTSIDGYGYAKKETEANKNTRALIVQKINNALNAAGPLTPGKRGEQAVVIRTSHILTDGLIEVKDHHATIK